MSDRVSGRPDEASPAAWTTIVAARGSLGTRAFARLGLIAGLAALLVGPAAPLAGAANGLTVTTPFPAVVVEPGGTASFKLSIDVASARQVALKANGVPDGWTARFRGGGLVVDGAYVTPSDDPGITLDIDVPDGATASTTNITVAASSGSSSDSLRLSLRIAEAAAGNVSLAADFPELRGPSSSTFTFNLTLKNDTAAESTFALDATGQAGWTVSAKPSGQAQATSATVAAGSTGRIEVTAQPPTDVAAGTYPIQVQATGGGKTVTADLQVVVTGTFTLTVSTPDQVLSTSANAGSEKDLQVVVQNTGTAPLTGVAVAATAPTGWTATAVPATIDSIAPQESATVTLQITPTSDSIAGDYNLTVKASNNDANGDATIRVRVETPQFWWIVGVVLIVATFAGLYWVFRTYGRR